MAHESFEDGGVARVLNENFVSVKVDREERPDVDAVYMSATQALTGHGGWPMSVFLDHDRRPFYAGTYWPKEPRHGMPSFVQVLHAISDAWATQRDEVAESATSIAQALASTTQVQPADEVDLAVTDQAAALIVDRAWDRALGGFGRAPKFPQAMTIGFLLDHHVRTGNPGARDAAVSSLDAMARGGINDHVGGGFARYSTDARWLVPHFEKMLYDNALLVDVYARAAALTGRDDLARVARETADYLVREMQGPGGGFYSATDADSEGVEGKFFVWPFDELTEVVASAGADPERFAAYFGATPRGNFTPEHPGDDAPPGLNILHEPVPRDEFAGQHGLDPDGFAADLARVRNALYERRQQRVAPGLDDKVLTSWNALAIRGLARAGAYLDEPRYVEAATQAAAFLRDHLVVDGRLQHTWKDGRASVPAFLEDVAGLAAALLDLAAAAADPSWIAWAVELAEDAVARFRDPAGGYFQTADDAETLVMRPKDTWDNATPSGNSLLASACWRLGLLTGLPVWDERAAEIVRAFQDQMAQSPTGFGELLQVVEALRAESREVAIVGRDRDDRDALARAYWAAPRVGTVLVVADPDDPAADDVPLLAGRTPVDSQAAAYVCRGFVCDAPTTDSQKLVELLSVSPGS